MVSNADCNSESICGEMALRFSGRLRVRTASSSGNSNFSVSNMEQFLLAFLSPRSARAFRHLWRLGHKLTAKLLDHGRVGVFRANFVGHFQERRQGGWIDARVASSFANGG